MKHLVIGRTVMAGAGRVGMSTTAAAAMQMTVTVAHRAALADPEM